MVANLERNDLVRRDRNPQNRRELIVSLTPQGRKLLSTYAHAVKALESKMTSALTPEQISVFRSQLNSCRVALGT
jgi:DNA-binding MarR family transcriptional regulator